MTLAATLTLSLLALSLLTLALLTAALLTSLAIALSLRAGKAAISVADHLIPRGFFLLSNIIIRLRGLRRLISRINRLTRRRLSESFRALFIQMAATFLIQAINRFDFAAQIRAAATIASGININIVKYIARVAAALRAAIIIFGLVGLAGLRIILRNRIRGCVLT